MKALIFAAGLGTRLRPITDNMPKALVPVGGTPMLERVLLKIKDTGISEFVVNTHHFSGQIRAFLASKDNFGVDVRVSEESGEPLETGGGIRHAQALLEGDGRFLVHNVDILSDISLKDFIAADRQDAIATLAVREAEADRYLLFNDEMRLVGWTNVKTGEVKAAIPDLNPEACRRYSFCGIHIISDDIFPLMASWPEKFGIIDLYLAIAAAHPIYGHLIGKPTLIDIGSPEKLAEAETVFGRLPKSE